LGATDDPSPRIAEAWTVGEGLLHVLELGRAIETTTPQVRVVPGQQFELGRSERRRYVDAGRGEAVEVRIAKLRIDDLDGAVALREAVGDERHDESERVL